ncbi:MAG: DUF3108 domain-containing protein [Cellulophaga sp.]|uniref:DUF3108 domain-containing protein n=1 Tax=unclassified Cellulophaga TaxID=2634405 RepID=UPI000C2CD815|nr:DUF3108 domain-containing protein [Cellulophaga sp. RHA19]PKB42912.1 uncharacterized protein DUF3108 [Cellulophaga sp. RHA19]
MKKVYLLFLLLATFAANSQNKHSSFKAGEWLRFRIHYGIFNASYATLQIKNDKVNGIPVYHVIGKGRTTGLARVFFKVDDTYESYFDKNHGKPYKFVRKVSEGSYTLNLDIDFDHKKKKAVLNDHKKNRKLDFKIEDNIQDLISAFYYVRNNYNADELVKNETITLNLLYDDDGIFKFKLKYLGKETLKTKYGKVECHKFRPYVESGRVFKEQESLSLWVSNDENKIPIRIKADLAVGSLKADLDGYAGLKHQFKIIMD